MNQLTVLDPTGRTADAESVARPGPARLDGARIAVLDNTKPGAVELMERIAEVLVGEHGADSYVVERKLSASQGASEEQLQGVHEACDLAITGSGDCGGCTSWSCHDAVALERLGTPTVLVCTDAFVRLARVTAERAGLPRIRIVEVEHPIGGQPRERIAALADAAVKSAVELLVDDTRV
ncbi:MAG: hypothetical protein GEV03_28365 [Streptosporangiales bacterium]|nr:hypothetical protein [Streptosporangiales bacterium]